MLFYEAPSHWPDILTKSVSHSHAILHGVKHQMEESTTILNVHSEYIQNLKGEAMGAIVHGISQEQIYCSHIDVYVCKWNN